MGRGKKYQPEQIAKIMQRIGAGALDALESGPDRLSTEQPARPFSHLRA